MNMGISFKVTLILFSSLIVFLSLQGIMFLILYNTSLHAISKDFNEQTLTIYERLLRTPISTQDYSSISEYVTAMQGYPQVIYAKILDKDGNSMSNRTNRITTELPNAQIIERRIMNDNEYLGKIEVSIAREYIDIQIHNYIIALIISIVVIPLLFGLVAIFIINIFILRPMRAVITSIRQLSKDKLTQRIPIVTSDEIGLFAQNFNSVLDELQQSIVLTNTIFESSPYAWVAFDENFRILRCNKNIQNFLNIDTTGNIIDPISIENIDQLYGLLLWDAIPFLARYKNVCEDVKDIKKPIKILREQLNQRYIQVQISPLSDGFGFVFRLEDVTDDEIKDSQIRQSLKMESLGILASGLAHDFNNVLSGVSSVVSILKYKIQNQSEIPLEKLSEIVNIIDLASNRASNMVKQMLTLSRKQELNYMTVDLNTCITNVIRICKSSFDKSIRIDTIYYPEKAITTVDPNQIESVILNLAINAWHAMTVMKKEHETKGGTLTIKLELVPNDKYILKLNPDLSYANNYWLISVSDTGVGIAPENKKKIYDPFFSTKDKERGTGLGLSMVSNIIQQHNGFIDFVSELGQGTRFMIYLPETAPHEITLHSITEDNNILKGNKETILVVDDEIIVREVISRILDEANYHYIMAENGKEAIRLYEKEHNKIDLVILNMAMPELTGLQTFQELYKINHSVLAILCSGFNFLQKENPIESYGIKAFLEKPFSMSKFTKVIWDVLHPE